MAFSEVDLALAKLIRASRGTSGVNGEGVAVNLGTVWINARIAHGADRSATVRAANDPLSMTPARGRAKIRTSNDRSSGGRNEAIGDARALRPVSKVSFEPALALVVSLKHRVKNLSGGREELVILDFAGHPLTVGHFRKTAPRRFESVSSGPKNAEVALILVQLDHIAQELSPSPA